MVISFFSPKINYRFEKIEHVVTTFWTEVDYW